MIEGHDHCVLDRQVIVSLANERSDEAKPLIEHQCSPVRFPNLEKSPLNPAAISRLERRKHQTAGDALATAGELRCKVQDVQLIRNDPADDIADDPPSGSRGPRGQMISVTDYSGLRFQDAIAQLASASIPFTFTVRRAQGQEKSGVIVSQTPEAGGEVPYGSVLQLVMTRPADLARGKVFGVFEYTLPAYPIMVDVSLDAVSPEGSATVVAMKHPGGPISIPYIVDARTELVFNVLDKEELRQAAGGQ